MFTAIDIGAEGRRSDGGVFAQSEIGQRLNNKTLNLPPPSSIVRGGPKLPYVAVADEAFGLSEHMMRPYPRSDGPGRDEKVFDYRLSRARRTVECAFGILSGRWRIFKKLICADTSTVIKIVQATTCLHNWLIQKELEKDRCYSVLTRRIANLASDGLVRHNGIDIGNISNDNAAEIRDAFKAYFNTTGAIPNQWQRADNNDY